MRVKKLPALTLLASTLQELVRLLVGARLTVTGVAEHVLAGNLRSAGKLLGH
jgi:hypothetical protein